MSSPEAEFPERFGPFVLLRELGVGGMGAAYLAMHAESQRLLVVKRMHPELVAEASIFKRFVHEAEAASHVHHPNVAALAMMGTVDGREPFLATEFVFGIQASQIVDRVEGAQIEPVPLRVAVHLALELAAGVEAIHSARHQETGAPLALIHRDIGARNVLVGFDGRVRIIDLGLGKSILSDWQTAAQVLAGSPDYMPPEQALGSRVDGRADVYSAAVTAWELIAGRKRIREEGIAQRLTRAVQAQPEPLLVHRPEASRRLEAILMQAMDPDPNARTPRAELLRRRLAEEEQALGGPVRAEEVAAWLEAACATVLAREKRILAEARARGLAFVGDGPSPAHTEVFVERAAVLMDPGAGYDFYRDPDRTIAPKVVDPEGPTYDGDVHLGRLAEDPMVRLERKLAGNRWIAALAALVDPDRFKAQPPHVQVLIAAGLMFVLVAVASTTALLVRPSTPEVVVMPSTEPRPDPREATGRPSTGLAADPGAPAGDTSAATPEIDAGRPPETAEDSTAPRSEPSEDAGTSDAAEPVRPLTPELAARKAVLVHRIRQLRRVRFDVGFQRRLTELSTRLSHARTPRSFDEIEGAIARLERET